MSAPQSIKSQKAEFKDRCFPNEQELKRCVCAHRTMNWLNAEWKRKDQLIITGYVAEQFARREHVDIIPLTREYIKKLESKEIEIGLSNSSSSMDFDYYGNSCQSSIKILCV